MITVAFIAFLPLLDGGALLATADEPRKRPPAVMPPPVLRAPSAPPPPVPVLIPPAPPAVRPAGNPFPEPRGNRASWVTTDDYPSFALREELEGVVEVQLSVGTTGRVGGCGIRESPDAPSLEEQTCRVLMRRARFHPATDADGRPVIGTYPMRIRWQIPGEPALPLPDGSPKPVAKPAALTINIFPLAKPTVDLATLITDADHPDAALAVRRGGLVSVRLLIDAGGAVAACVPIWVYLDPDQSQSACALFTERARFEPAIGDDGAPVSSSLYASHYWVPFPATLPISLQPTLPPTSR